MYSTQVYNYIPRQIVVLNIGSSPRRYNTVYAKPLTLHKGVDNVIQFQFINQEEKPVDITSAVTSPNQITFRFISYDGTEVLLQKALTPSWTGNTTNLNLTGILELRVTSGEVEDIDPQSGSYSLEIPRTIRGNGTVGTTTTTFDMPVFVDANSGARGKLTLVDSVLPSHVPSMEVTIPSHSTPDPSSPPVTYYSSTVDTSANPVLTVQQNFTDFIGNVQLQGSTTGTDWYTITSPVEYDSNSYIGSNTISSGTTIVGFHPYVRLKYVSTDGTVDKILAR